MKKSTKVFIQILKNSVLWKALIGYVFAALLIPLAITYCEPQVITYGDSLWYSFAACTTIGFGDFTAVTFLGRTLTVILYLYTAVVLGLLTALFTQYFLEMAKVKQNDSILEFQHDLEHLPELPPERLAEMSERIKKMRSK